MTIIIHLWTNFIGIYLFTTKNCLSRVAFLNEQKALTFQKDVIEQNSKMVLNLLFSFNKKILFFLNYKNKLKKNF